MLAFNFQYSFLRTNKSAVEQRRVDSNSVDQRRVASSSVVLAKLIIMFAFATFDHFDQIVGVKV
jgi:hypothetical protein